MQQITGHPKPFVIGRRVLMVSYVSMVEWQTSLELYRIDAVQATLGLVYCSLHRGDSSVSRRYVRRLARWHPKAMDSLMKLIVDLSLPELKPKDKAGIEPDSKAAEKHLKTVYRLLSRQNGWTPLEIGQMSPAQVHICLTGGEDGSGVVKMSAAEYATFRAKRDSI